MHSFTGMLNAENSISCLDIAEKSLERYDVD